MRVAWFPQSKYLEGNPYWELLQKNLEKLGIEFDISLSGFYLAKRWLWSHRKRVDVLHFHFIQFQYSGESNRVSFKRMRWFAENLLLARLLGYRIVWTVHDLLPTWEIEPKWGEYLARLIIAHLSHGVIVHCSMARQLVAERFKRRTNVFVIPHPSFIGRYQDYFTREHARKQLGLNEEIVLLFFGGIRPNKGIERLINSFNDFQEDNLVLIIAGRTWPPASYLEEITSLAKQDPRVHLIAENIPDDEVQIYFKAANIVVLPFVNILTSSSVMLAMSFGRPVIAPAIGCLPEIILPDEGILYDPQDPKGLNYALLKVLKGNLEEMGNRAYQRVQLLTWENMAVQTLQVYKNENCDIP